MNKRALTHEELLLSFLESMNTVVTAINDRNRILKEDDDYDERTQIHKTRVIIKRWFFDQGGLLL